MNDALCGATHDFRLRSQQRSMRHRLVASSDCFFNFADERADPALAGLVDRRATFDLAYLLLGRRIICHDVNDPILISFRVWQPDGDLNPYLKTFRDAKSEMRVPLGGRVYNLMRDNWQPEKRPN